MMMYAGYPPTLYALNWYITPKQVSFRSILMRITAIIAWLIFLVSCDKNNQEAIAQIQSQHATLRIASASVTNDTLVMVYQFIMKPDWHIYWHNPGESGYPPSFHWEFNQPLQIQEPNWPAPKRLGNGVVVSYGMGDTVYITQQIIRPPAPSKQSHSSQGNVQVDWLECKEECIPFSGSLQYTIHWQQNRPRPGASWLPKALEQKPKLYPAQVRTLHKNDSLFFDLGVLNIHNLGVQNTSNLQDSSLVAYMYPNATLATWFSASAPQSIHTHSARKVLAVPAPNIPTPKPTQWQGVLELQAHPDSAGLAWFSVVSPIVYKPKLRN
jgi:DsbC/DsbD-like thiol-disulfide interchange protein